MTQQVSVTAKDIATYNRAQDVLKRLARTDPAAFASYVMRDEETNQKIKLRPMHREWHSLISSHKRLLIWGHVESGKSTMISVARTLYELGRNPSLRCVIVSQSDDQAKKITGLIAKYIKYSKELREVFPNLVPDDAALWNQHEMYVKRPTRAKDPSIRSIGMNGKIQGARIDWLILDDILGYDSVATPAKRNNAWGWVMSELVNRVTEHGRTVVVGNAWHTDDVMHRMLAIKGAYYSVKYPLINRNGESTWPDRWSIARIADKRNTSLPLEFASKFMCQAFADDSYWFRREWLDNCVARGKNLKLLNQLARVPAGYQIFTGVDLSTGKKHGDLTVLFTIAVHPNGDRQVLMVESGRWDAPTILQRIKETHDRYRSIMIVEDNAAQSYIGQMLTKSSAIPVRAYTTTAKTHSRNPQHGMGRMATELSNGKWLIPSLGGQVHREVQEWMTECLQYDSQTHPGDRLMASLFASEGPNFRKPVGKVVPFNSTAR